MVILLGVVSHGRGRYLRRHPRSAGRTIITATGEVAQRGSVTGSTIGAL